MLFAQKTQQFSKSWIQKTKTPVTTVFHAQQLKRSFSLEHHLIPAGEELSWALITPKSLAKSHTGGILARLLAVPGIRLVGARMFQSSNNFHKEFLAASTAAIWEDGVIEPYEEALLSFIENDLKASTCQQQQIPPHFLLLLFSGKDTRAKLSQVVGGDHIPDPHEYGRTIRGTYGDFLKGDGKILKFDPAVLTAHTPQSNRNKLQIFAKYSDLDGGVMPATDNSETGLVVLKPDNFTKPSALPGHILDLFGTTGLQIVGTKVFSFSPKKAKEFYGFLEDIFVEKLKPTIEQKLRLSFQYQFDFPVTDEDFHRVADVLKVKYAKSEVNKIMSYMTGLKYEFGVPFDDPEKEGPARCLGIVLRGKNAISIIRQKLGSTDPRKADPGTIRSDYGNDVMRNAAHASDSVSAFQRETKIIGLVGDEPSLEKKVIEDC
eukprot:TRINITY_DN1525_c0_g1_i2.p1 TRINITY_DN1525_c0_g1~~TRINITY_DN1525_c0_g1_i2.p1  ORF type:complete len:463 (-),score=152.58 TRINITY_DN1525_c0_g1_i2:73-1371(-)